jgi:hypothetical protein
MHNWKNVANDDVLVPRCCLQRQIPFEEKHNAGSEKRGLRGLTLDQYLLALVSLLPREDLVDPRPRLDLGLRVPRSFV